ncbi:MAG: NADPH-dependent assimilatory sulfite reductase hemoprotein subunit [Acidimicrobiales bacterium]
MPTDPPDRSAVEATKEASRHLRGDLPAELGAADDAFTNDGAALLKFHGIYQQDDRDVRRERKLKGLGLSYRCMIRTKIPGGAVDADQYLALDRLADEVADGTLRVTTRQDIQYHFVHKADLAGLVAAVNRAHLTTFGACGDVVRNVVCCPAPLPDGRQDELLDAATTLTRRLLPQTEAYWELWIDGERAATAQPPAAAAAVEPLYGATYLPRKFKIGIAWPGDNCIDVLTQDFGAVPADGPSGKPGFVVFAGGGLGQSHADEDTFPRLADAFAWIPAAALPEVAEAVVGVHRDFGNRKDRRRARLKYVIDERGLDWFTAEVARRVDVPLHPPGTFAPWRGSPDHLGWHEQADGPLFLGVPVANGRIRDTEHGRQRTALREVVARFRPGIRFTARQDVLLTGLDPADRGAVEAIFRRAGSPLATDLTPVRRLALACPALPTCGQALAEAERVMPEVVDQLELALAGLGLDHLPIDVRMTGCPNGCARPYTAEIGVVGRTKRGYDVYVGGAPSGDRLAGRLAKNVKLEVVVDTLRPLLERWRSEAPDGEPFGDFWSRVGLPEVEEPVLVGAGAGGAGGRRR